MTEQPPGDPHGRPTEPLPPSGSVPPAGAPAASQDVTVDDYPVTTAELAEQINRNRFWSIFGAVAGLLAAIAAVIAIVLALNAKDDADQAKELSAASGQATSATVQSDVNDLQKEQQDQAQQLDNLDSSVNSLEKQVGSNTGEETVTTQQFDQLQKQVSDLSDQVDQLQKDLESASGGDSGGGSP